MQNPRIVEARVENRPTQGIVTVSTRGLNQDGKEVMSFGREGKFTLRFGCIHQPGPFRRGTHCRGSTRDKPAVEAYGIKNIARRSQRVAAPLQLTQVSDWFNF